MSSSSVFVATSIAHVLLSFQYYLFVRDALFFYALFYAWYVCAFLIGTSHDVLEVGTLSIGAGFVLGKLFALAFRVPRMHVRTHECVKDGGNIATPYPWHFHNKRLLQFFVIALVYIVPMALFERDGELGSLSDRRTVVHVSLALNLTIVLALWCTMNRTRSECRTFWSDRTTGTFRARSYNFTYIGVLVVIFVVGLANTLPFAIVVDDRYRVLVCHVLPLGVALLLLAASQRRSLCAHARREVCGGTPPPGHPLPVAAKIASVGGARAPKASAEEDPRDLWVYTHFYNIGIILQFYLHDWVASVLLGITLVEFVEQAGFALCHLLKINPRKCSKSFFEETAYDSGFKDPLSVALGILLVQTLIWWFGVPLVHADPWSLRVWCEIALLMLTQNFSGITSLYWRLPLLHAVVLVIVLCVAAFPPMFIGVWLGVWFVSWITVGYDGPGLLHYPLFNAIVAWLSMTVVAFIVHLAID